VRFFEVLEETILLAWEKEVGESADSESKDGEVERFRPFSSFSGGKHQSPQRFFCF
jgi:hypothetical protein